MHSPPIYFKPALFSSPAEIEQRDQSITFIAKHCGEIVGFITLHSREPFIHTDNAAEFEIVVNPGYRNRGLGKKLLYIVIQYANNKTKLNQLNAKIPAENDASKRLCEKCGFQLLHKESKGSVMTLEIAR